MLSATWHKQSRRPAPKYVSSKKLQPLILIVVLLFKSSHAQHVNFLLCEEAPVAAAEILLSQTCKEHTVELDNSVSETFEDTANDTVLAAVYLDAHLALVCCAGILDGVGMHLAVLKSYACGYLLHVVSSNLLVEEDVINLLLQEFRMSELAGQIAVVGEQEHSCGVSVKASYGIDTLRTCVLYEIHHSLALLRVVACCNTVLWLVEKHVYLLLH